MVNNAGQGEWGLFVETDIQRQLDIIHLNLVVLVTLTRHFLADMVARGEGKILQAGAVHTRVYGESPLSNPADVARDGHDALMAGNSSIVSGLRMSQHRCFRSPGAAGGPGS